MDIWKSVWNKPRETVRYLIEHPPNRFLIFLILTLAGIENNLNDEKGETNLSEILLLAIILGPISGFFLYHIPSYVTKWTGKWFGGKATIREIRLVTFIASIPMVTSLIIWLPLIFIYGIDVFKSEITDTYHFFSLYNVLSFLKALLYLWSLVIFIRALSEVQEFSIRKAILNTFLPAIIVIALLLLISIPLFL